MASVLGFVVVDSNGNVLHSSGVEEVIHFGPGYWHIFFDFSVANACEVASLGTQVPYMQVAAYAEPDIAENEVTVQTYNNYDLKGTDTTFQLAVIG
jgi:hypothetical protein